MDEITTNNTTDKFNPENLRLSQNFLAMGGGVKKHLLSVPVRKPNKQDFVRVHPSKNYRLEGLVLEIKDENETYLVQPSLYNELLGDAVPKVILTAITKQNALFLWPIRLPDTDGKLDTWNSSALEAAKIAETAWVRVSSNKHMAGYDVYEAIGTFQEPEWPDTSFSELLKIAFKDRFIENLDHHALKKLRGEI